VELLAGITWLSAHPILKSVGFMERLPNKSNKK
jgi:hypothetical protein